MIKKNDILLRVCGRTSCLDLPTALRVIRYSKAMALIWIYFIVLVKLRRSSVLQSNAYCTNSSCLAVAPVVLVHLLSCDYLNCLLCVFLVQGIVTYTPRLVSVGFQGYNLILLGAHCLVVHSDTRVLNEFAKRFYLRMYCVLQI